MGLRGPLPDPPALRALKGGRRRRSAAGLGALEPDVVKELRERAAVLEAFGRAMLKRAQRRPVVKSKANGEQVSPALRMALASFEACDRVYARLARLPNGESAKPDDWDGLIRSTRE